MQIILVKIQVCVRSCYSDEEKHVSTFYLLATSVALIFFSLQASSCRVMRARCMPPELRGVGVPRWRPAGAAVCSAF